MKTRVYLIVLFLNILALLPALSQPQKFGAGLIIGAPTGLSVKYWSTQREAIQAYAGGGFGGLAFGADYVLHSNEFKDPNLLFYYGPGAFVGPATYGGPRFAAGTFGLGVRFILGANYLIPNSRFDLAFEIGPALVLAPSTGIGLEAGLAFRFYP